MFSGYLTKRARRLLSPALLVVCLGVATLASARGIVNQATNVYVPGFGATPVQQTSGEVLAQLPARPAMISFFHDENVTDKAYQSAFGEIVYLAGLVDACNKDPRAIETVTMVLHNPSTGDDETFTAVETGVDSGKFKVPHPLWAVHDNGDELKDENDVIDATPSDTVNVWMDDCAGSRVVNKILIDPAGVVYDSVTNAPIPGVTVTLIDVTGAGNGGHPGEPAIVVDFDDKTPMPSTIVTGADGAYLFPLVRPSQYKLNVKPPGDYAFPSTHAANALPTERAFNVTGSYGKDFEVSADTGTVIFDVPLDSSPNGLFAQKLASRTVVEMAESIEYSVLVRNVSGLTVNDITVRDDMPKGFTFLKGSAKLDDQKITDPQVLSARALVFSVGNLNDGESRTLTYRMQIGAGAVPGNNVNRAQAFSRVPAIKQSNVASVNVKVEGGVFDDSAYILGKVFADCNVNGIQDSGEPGVAGTRLYLEDGSFVIADGEGKFSFYGVHPRTHVLKVDATSLPEGTKLVPLTHRNGGDGKSLFIDAKRGELHRADFAIDSCEPPVLNQLEARRLLAQGHGDELAREASAELKVETVSTSVGDTRSLPASGIVQDQLRQQVAAELAAIRGSEAPKPLAELAPTLNDQLDFVGLKDGDIAFSSRLTVRVKGRARSQIDLALNGEKIDEKSIGSRTIVEETQVEAREYIGLALKPGENVLTLTQADQWGNPRGSKQITIRAPGDLDHILVLPPADATAADSDGVAKVHVELLDSRGLRIASRTPVTLETSLGEWQAIDTDPAAPGVQTIIENGSADFGISAPLAPGDANLIVSSGRIEGRGTVSFVPRLRPMIASGLVEGSINLRKLDANSPQRNDDGGFEDALSSLSWDDKKNDAGARAALFVKGEVADEYLLTIGYDSDKDTNEALFRDIQPDKFYPTYGDSSIKGFDAQSTGHLYARVDKDKSFLLLGDFTTQALSQARQLGAYNRGLNGLKDRYQTDRFTIETFASHDDSRQVVQEVPGNGTSGPYALTVPNSTQNSERVEILTRDRNQPGIVIDTQLLSRFVDYQIDEFTGSLILRSPVPSLDESLNPISIRITYEIEQGGPEFWVAGMDSQVRVTDRLSVGAAFVNDADPLDSTNIGSTNTTIQITEHMQLIGELARSDRDSIGTGWGRRLELRQEGEKLRVRAFAGRADDTFDNPSSTLTKSREEAGLRSAYSINERTHLLGEALHSEDVVTGANRDGGLLGVERSFDGNIKIEAGVRQVHDVPATGSTLEESDTTSVRTKVATPVPYKPEATIYGEYEQDINESDKQMAAVGGEYQLKNRSRLYMRHEFITSLTGPYNLNDTTRRNSTVFGVDTRYMQDDRFFSEYRVGDSFDGRDTQAAIGLRNKWNVAEGVRLSTQLERTDTLKGTGEGQTAAISAGLEYTRNPLWKGTSRVEVRTSDTTDGLFSTMGLAKKISDEWTFLGRNALAISEYNTSDQPDDVKERFQLGFAYREDGTNRINGLGRYELKHEEGSTADGGKRDVHMVSGHMDFQPTNIWIFTGQYAAKLAVEDADDLKTHSNAQLFGGRVTRDIGKKWDAGIAMRELVSSGFKDRQSSIGAEVGYVVMQNLWVSVGYNITGFYDRDLSEGNYTNRGAYLRFRFKFDESLFGERWAHEGSAP